MADETVPQTPAGTPPDTAPATKAGQTTVPTEQGEDKEPHWLKPRLERAEQNAVKGLLKELGVDDPAALKALLKDAQALKESQMSEADKSKAALAKAEERAVAAEKKAADVEAARLTEKVNAAITTAAMAAKAEHPEDVVTMARLATEEVDGLLDKTGNVDSKKLTTLIDRIKKERPGWFQRSGIGSPSNRNGDVPEPNASEKQAGQRALMANLRNKF